MFTEMLVADFGNVLLDNDKGKKDESDFDVGPSFFVFSSVVCNSILKTTDIVRSFSLFVWRKTKECGPRSSKRPGKPSARQRWDEKIKIKGKRRHHDHRGQNAQDTNRGNRFGSVKEGYSRQMQLWSKGSPRDELSEKSQREKVCFCCFCGL